MGLKISPTSQVNEKYEIDLSPSIRDFLSILESYPAIEKTPKYINIGFSCIDQKSIPEKVINRLKLYE